ncbi:hypothetical protein OIDMADRAFT_16814 [Oidiodendron maius Zn]|uniref:Uncharacterized protein n=1 Tax=Oidiodendron maius (strain Zn) TaxID=913774 RepID=A0A0C3I205_OIDMZ|nr:hypothetical protein OIDMADRAFT_16814 [Oidiodendron maius Zn]
MDSLHSWKDNGHLPEHESSRFIISVNVESVSTLGMVHSGRHRLFEDMTMGLRATAQRLNTMSC